MVPIQTPATEIVEMILIALCDFLETRYRFAMKKGKFKENQLVFNFRK
jgi:hypothetical protein